MNLDYYEQPIRKLERGGMNRTPLLLEMDGLLAKAKAKGGFQETVVLIEQAIKAQEASESGLDKRTVAYCAHYGWTNATHRPRTCPDCGAMMWNAGD